MTPIEHAQRSAEKHGGEAADYLPLHAFFDQSKAHHTGFKHRAILHHGLGIAIAEQVFGPLVAGVPTRILAIEHIKEDLGWVPTVSDWLNEMKGQGWMQKRTKAMKPKPGGFGQLDREFFESLNPNKR